MDSVSKEKRSSIMRLVKSKDTALEKSFRRELWKQGVRYRKNNAALFGKPDISIIGKRAVIFIDSCYWHGCPDHVRMPHSNVEYWENKIEKNKKRDIAVNEHYENKKWTICRFWEHEIKRQPEEAIEKVKRTLAELHKSTKRAI